MIQKCDWCGRRYDDTKGGCKSGHLFTQKHYCSKQCRYEAQQSGTEEAEKQGCGYKISKSLNYIVVILIVIFVLVGVCSNLNSDNDNSSTIDNTDNTAAVKPAKNTSAKPSKKTDTKPQTTKEQPVAEETEESETTPANNNGTEDAPAENTPQITDEI